MCRSLPSGMAGLVARLPGFHKTDADASRSARCGRSVSGAAAHDRKYTHKPGTQKTRRTGRNPHHALASRPEPEPAVVAGPGEARGPTRWRLVRWSLTELCRRRRLDHSSAGCNAPAGAPDVAPAEARREPVCSGLPSDRAPSDGWIGWGEDAGFRPPDPLQSLVRARSAGTERAGVQDRLDACMRGMRAPRRAGWVLSTRCGTACFRWARAGRAPFNNEDTFRRLRHKHPCGTMRNSSRTNSEFLRPV